MSDEYPIPSRPSQGEFRDRGSKFLAALRHVRTEEAALAVVAARQRAHPKCNHHCYAYRLGEGEDRWRANDDGEPGGTAGLPILAQIDKAGIRDVVIVVSRYFGGTKLGTSGLINAYREAARLAITAGVTEVHRITTRVTLEFSYEWMTPVMSALSQLHLEMADQDFAARATIRLELPRSEAATIIRALKAAIAGVYPEEVTQEFGLPGLTIST